MSNNQRGFITCFDCDETWNYFRYGGLILAGNKIMCPTCACSISPEFSASYRPPVEIEAPSSGSQEEPQ